MARNKPVTEAEVNELLDRIADLGADASEMAGRIEKSFGVDFERPAQMASGATAAVRNFSDLASKLAVAARYQEDTALLRAQLQAELKKPA